jgi:hypothetical protein
MKHVAIGTYLLALTAANLLIAELGKPAILFNAFFLIGLDLALRDWLHHRMGRLGMLGLIVSAGVLTWALNPAASHIAQASAISFALAAVADWAVYSAIPRAGIARSNASNVAGAAVDSAVFPLLVYGSADPLLAGPMFAAKVLGGAAWTFLLHRQLGLTK